MREVTPRPAAAPGTILSIDPGHTHSAWVEYDAATGRPLDFGKVENQILLGNMFDVIGGDVLVIEQVACMGMAVGAEVFETVFWSGRFCEAADEKEIPWHRVKRHEVKQFLCQNQRAKDSNIRQAILDRYGGKDRAIGKKKSPGPLYGIKGDCWSALSVAITWANRNALLPEGGESR